MRSPGQSCLSGSSSGSELLVAIVQGTSARLESGVAAVRRQGMEVAEAMAKVLQHDLRFDELDEGCLATIMSLVPFKDRLTCAITVCKAWRELRRDPALWTELKVSSAPSAFRLLKVRRPGLSSSVLVASSALSCPLRSLPPFL